MSRLGLIVNPIAGIGGTVALKGSDGSDTIALARRLGGEPIAPRRAIEMLAALKTSDVEVEIVTYPAEMGEDAAVAAELEPTVIGAIASGATTAADTVRAANELRDLGVELLLFVGGDGTARDVFEAVNGGLPVVGVPAGVKLQSSVFAVNTRRAAEIVAAFLRGATATRELEVMDIDEDLARAGRLSARLYGYLSVPDQPRLLQGAKAGSRSGDNVATAIAARVCAEMDDHTYYVLGPGTTIRAITDRLGIDKTLLGVDVVHGGELVARDATERELLEIVSQHRGVVIVTVVGGQGYVLGRGNQQISPQVIQAVGPDNVVIVATRDKLHSLDGPLRVDTGDPECDRTLAGHRRVITGRHEDSVWRVEA